MTSDDQGLLAQTMEAYGAKELRKLAYDMPHRGEAKKGELAAWLAVHYPERLTKVVQSASVAEEEVLSAAAASPTVKKSRTKKAVEPNPNIGSDNPTPPASYPGVTFEEIEEWHEEDGPPDFRPFREDNSGMAAESNLAQAIDEAREQGIPALLGECTVSLHFELDDASTPLEAVEQATRQMIRQGLAVWTWLVRDEITDEVYAVRDGRMVSLKEARDATS